MLNIKVLTSRKEIPDPREQTSRIIFYGAIIAVPRLPHRFVPFHFDCRQSRMETQYFRTIKGRKSDEKEREKEKSRRLYNYQECSQDLTCVQSGTKPFDGFFSRKTVCRRTGSAGMISSLLGKRYSESSERKTPRRSPGPSTGPSESLWGCASPVAQ
ncbi:hypothetical protein HN011_009239 [Eciton burchellii]|nr:hypothetical protein HN011_009239 [Eciton burchellii]